MKNKKDLLGGVIIIVLLLLVLVTYMSFYNIKKEEKELDINDISDNSLSIINVYDDYTTLKLENTDNINANKEIIGSYNCKNDDCVVYTNQSFDSLTDNRFLVLKENEKIFIYDFILNKIVSKLYDDIIDILSDNYYVVKDNYKYGIISKSGVEIVSSIYDEVLTDQIYDSYVKVKKDNLYGIVDLDNGNVIIDTKYDNISINDSKYYSILKDNLWYVMDKEENVITNGYNYVFAFNKGYIALVDNTLQILKYNTEEVELLNNNVMDIYELNGYNIKRDGGVINIEITNGDNIIKYQYNINRNNLISK